MWDVAGQHGNASKGAIAVVRLLNSGECGFERSGSGVDNARHGASPDEWLRERVRQHQPCRNRADT